MLDCGPMPMCRAFARAALPIAFVAAAFLAHAAPVANAAEPLAFTFRTVDNDTATPAGST